MLETVMSGLGTRCDYSNYTSEDVFAVEVDPVIANSMLRNQDELVEVFCTQGTFLHDWQTVLEGMIIAVPTPMGEIETLKRTIHPDPGYRDLSLIVAALNLSTQTGQDSVIVTDDISLSDQINQLRINRKQVFLNGNAHSTSRLTVKLSLQILRELYVSCGIDHELWSSALHSYKNHYNGHYGEAGKKHCQHVTDFYSQYHIDRAEKEHGCLIANQEFDFGVAND